MLEEWFLYCDGELVCGPACRIQLEHQGAELEAHRVLDGFRVPDVVAAEYLLQPCPLGRDAPDPACAAEGGLELRDGQFRRPAWCRGRCCEDDACIRPNESVLLAEEGIRRGRAVVSQQ